MRKRVKLKYVISLLAWVTILVSIAWSPMLAAQSTGSLSGTVKDPSGAVLPGTTVTLTPAHGGQPATAVTNAQGAYQFRGLAPGAYTISVYAPGFTTYVKQNVTIRPGQPQRLPIALAIASVSQQVQVSAEAPQVNINPESNVSSVTISSKNLQAFSDDPDELESELLALAGPSVGPNGGQIYVDGFTIDTEIPPKDAIREVRINQNPFSPEYDQLGYGRIEIITKPGTNKYHGTFTADGNDLAFDTKDPFAASEPGYYSFLTSGDVSGPIRKLGSFFLNYQHRNIESNDLVNAVVLNSSEVQTPYAQTLTAPSTLDVGGPRLDFALTPNNYVMLSYQVFRGNNQNLGVGQFALPSQAYTLSSLQHVIRASDTQIVGAKFVNELRFQAQQQSYTETPASTGPEILVIGGFTGGGNTQGGLNYHHHHLEFDDVATLSLAQHTLTFGGRVRTVVEPYVSPTDFNGTFAFSSLSTYAAGAPMQFTITTGDPLTRIFSEDTGLYFSDDWRVHPNMMLSYGLRFETQNFIPNHADWAPRIGFAYGLGRKSNPKTVLRAGFGIFYDRFSQQLQVQVEALNGTRQTEYLVNNPDFYPNIPTTAELMADSGGAASTVYRMAPNLHAPYTLQTAIGLEQQISSGMTLSVTYLNSIGNDQLISDNINAPLPGTYNVADPTSGTRPDPSLGNVYEYESAAKFRQNQLITNFTILPSRNVSLFGYYSLNFANSDTAGAASFPDNPYDIAEDYGRAAFDIHQRAMAGGTIFLKYGILLSPLLNFQSGTPYNFTIGQDLLGSTIFNQRPAFATASTPSADIVSTPYGQFNIDPTPGEPLIPINYGTGPDDFVMNLRVSKTFSFGKAGGEHAAGGLGGFGGGGGGGSPAMAVGTAHASRGGNLGSRGLGGGVGSNGSGGSSNRRFNLTFGAEARNLFNEVNLAPPVGNLTSPLFGKSNGLAGGVYSFSGTNRRIDFQTAFTF